MTTIEVEERAPPCRTRPSAPPRCARKLSKQRCAREPRPYPSRRRKQQHHQQSESTETLVQLEARAAIQLHLRHLRRRHLAQRTPPRPLAQLNNFGRRGQSDVRGGQAGAKGESDIATKKVMVRVGGG